MLHKTTVLCLGTLLLLSFSLSAQIRTNKAILEQAAKIQAAKEQTTFQNLLALSAKNGWKMIIRTKTGLRLLKGVDPFGYPLYVTTDNTLQSAATIGTNQLWSGGSLGLTLSGSSNNVKGKMGIWDGGKVRGTHVELSGRVIQKDGNQALEDHSTHVAGILTGTGINPLARGMAYGLQELWAYDFSNDVSEMLNAGSNLLVSNHSYSTVSGWNYNETENRWEFSGRFGENEDYKFGAYTGETQQWDMIAYNAPYYLIVKAAGNNRNQNGPAVGDNYWRYNVSGQLFNAGPRPAGISSNNSYDIIPTYGTAKNILTVGAVQPIPSGYNQPSDVVMSSFSSWGPTDDGRIKPDVVADGVTITSATAVSDNSYGSLSGTSMASPSAAGSALLLQEYYSQLHGSSFMRSATLKGIIIHTADEAGSNAGPDYQYGWGLMNVAKAAEVIKSNNTNGHFVYENIRNNGDPIFSQTITASGNGPLVFTICWTDPESNVDQTGLNDHTPRLINDLDIRIKQGVTTYFPWKLNPSSPASAATKGDNNVDNVEKIELANPVAGQYTIEITHKGTLARGSQAYSLIVSDYGVNFVAPVAIDLAATGLASPYLSGCASGSQLVSVRIKNTGTTDRTNIPVTTVIKNGATTVATLTGTYPGTIKTGEEVTYTYSTRFNAVAGNTYTFTTTVSFAGDQNSANNQRVSTVTINATGTPPTNLSAEICDNKATLRATAANGQVFWYESIGAVDPIAIGTDTTSNVIPSNLTYYAAVNDGIAKAGPTDKTISGSGRYNTLVGNYLKFTSYIPFTIESARMYIGHSGKIKFTIGKVVNATQYQPIASNTINVYATDPTPQVGEQIGNDPLDVGAIFLLNLPVPETGDYYLIMECMDGATLFYNSNIGSNPYPFTTPGILSIIGNSTTNNPQGFYIGLYDMGIKLYGCASPRVAVPAISCEDEAPVIIYPNPAVNRFQLKGGFGQTAADLNITIMTLTGKVVYTTKYASFSGYFSNEIFFGSIIPGLYVVRIDHGGKRYTKKLIVLDKNQQ